MSTITVQKPGFSRTSSHELRVYHNIRRISSSWTMMSSKSTPAWREKELPGKLQKLSVIPPTYDLSNIRFHQLQRTDQVAIQRRTIEFGQFLAREAQLDQEYWTAAWLRAEAHWEDRENDRYAENYIRKFAEQEFYAMKKRYNAQFGEKCKCIVTVKKEDENMKRTIPEGVVGNLDLSIRYLSYGETFPGERVKAPLFCLIDRKASSRYGYIANLCVSKLARRQGIARRMLQFAILSAKEQGAEKVFVHVHRDNRCAKDLYQKLGFEVVDAASPQLSAGQTYLLCLNASN